MNTFDRHLLREWLQILGLILVVFCGLLCVQICYDDVRELREAGARGWDLLAYVGVRMPSFAMVVLPVSLLLSLLYVLAKFHRANEFTAMRVAGIGFLRLSRPLWLVGVLCCGVAWWFNATVVPWSVERSRTMKESHEFKEQSRSLPPDRIGAVNNVGFDNRGDGRMWFFNRYSRAAKRGYGAYVSELNSQRRELTRIIAAEAWFDPARHGWEFERGRELRFDPETGEVVSSRPFSDEFIPGFQEDPELMLLVDRKPSDLSFFELRRLIAYFGQTGSDKAVPYAVRYYGLLAETLVPLLVIAIAVPFAVAGVRTNPAVGVSKSIGLFFLYYVLDNLAASIAAKQWADPMLAAWLPNAVMAAVALWLFARLR